MNALLLINAAMFMLLFFMWSSNVWADRIFKFTLLILSILNLGIMLHSFGVIVVLPEGMKWF